MSDELTLFAERAQYFADTRSPAPLFGVFLGDGEESATPAMVPLELFRRAGACADKRESCDIPQHVQILQSFVLSHTISGEETKSPFRGTVPHLEISIPLLPATVYTCSFFPAGAQLSSPNPLPTTVPVMNPPDTSSLGN